MVEFFLERESEAPSSQLSGIHFYLKHCIQNTLISVNVRAQCDTEPLIPMRTQIALSCLPRLKLATESVHDVSMSQRA